MDVQWYSSIAGIAAVAVALGQAAKRYLADVNGPNKVPLVVYVFVFAVLGTWFANGVLGTLEGQFVQLATDAVTAALVAIGAFNAVTHVAKPLSLSGSIDPRGTFGGKLPIIFLAVGLTFSMACATSQKERVVVAYHATQTTLAAFQDAERALYSLRGIPDTETHRKILRALVTAFDAQHKVGGALLVWQTGEPIPSEVSEWFTEVDRVLVEVQALVPDVRIYLVRDVLKWAEAIVELTRHLRIAPPASVSTFISGATQ